ncbi:MAG: methionyl-tRNA formyltransferase [Planctomycetota bacterium]
MRIVFVGTSELGIPSLFALKAAGGYAIRVITKPDALGGRGCKVIFSPVKEAAMELDLHVEQPVDINASESLDRIRAFKPDLMVVASFWAKLSNELLSIPRLGGINIHPSLLPRFRGAAPIQHALLAGDPVTGVTIFQIRQKMDSGEILGQVDAPIQPDDDYLSLHDRLSDLAASLLLQVLIAMENGTAQPFPQDHASAVNAPKITKEQGRIRWDADAPTIERQVRALSLWPGAYTFYMNRSKEVRVILASVEVIKGDESPSSLIPGEVLDCPGRLVVACGGGSLLEIHRLKREGKKEMPAAEFLRGIRLDPGSVLGAQ